MSLSISRDCDHAIPTLINFIRDGPKAIRPQSLRRSGTIFARTSVSSHVISYLGCMRNTITRSKCYLNDAFWAGTTTTGRSKSMNAYFEGYAHSNTMLNEFVVQYDKVVHVWREADEKGGFVRMNIRATLSGSNPIEKIAGERNTHRVFKKF